MQDRFTLSAVADAASSLRSVLLICNRSGVAYTSAGWKAAGSAAPSMALSKVGESRGRVWDEGADGVVVQDHGAVQTLHQVCDEAFGDGVSNDTRGAVNRAVMNGSGRGSGIG